MFISRLVIGRQIRKLVGGQSATCRETEKQITPLAAEDPKQIVATNTSGFSWVEPWFSNLGICLVIVRRFSGNSESAIGLVRFFVMSIGIETTPTYGGSIYVCCWESTIFVSHDSPL